MLIDLVAVIVPAAVGLGLLGWMTWDINTRHGPLTPGNRRWRLETDARAARHAHNDAVQALTDDDRTWLTERGWRP